VEFLHVNPGKGSAFVRTKLKNLETKQVVDITFKSGDKVEKPNLEFHEMQFLYADKTSYIFMDNASYEQISLTHEDVGNQKFYLPENATVYVTFFNARPVVIEVDNFVQLVVIETQPNIKGDTSSGGGKPATVSTGLTLVVPFHVNVGDILKIDTRTGAYVEKTKRT